MPAVLILTVIIQACFVFHVLKTGRPYWWAYIILGFPALGCVVYYLVEIFPGSREHRSARKAVREIAKAMKPDAELQRRAEEVQICGSVEYKVSLAEECVSAGLFDEAVRRYQSSLCGPHATDPSLLYGLARAQFHSGHYAAARGALAQVEQAQPAFKSGEVKLLHARIRAGRFGRRPGHLREVGPRLCWAGSEVPLCPAPEVPGTRQAGQLRVRGRCAARLTIQHIP